MPRLFLSRHIEDGNGRAGYAAACARRGAPAGGKRSWYHLRVIGMAIGTLDCLRFAYTFLRLSCRTCDDPGRNPDLAEIHLRFWRAGSTLSCEAAAQVDLINSGDPVRRAREVEALGVDIVCVHTAFDVQHVADPLETLRRVSGSVHRVALACVSTGRWRAHVLRVPDNGIDRHQN
eukprot:COSAG01_NODE_26023_length_726_cov_0.610845_1_plen_176_part_00